MISIDLLVGITQQVVDTRTPIDVSPEVARNTYAISHFIMDIVKWVLSILGLSDDHTLVNFIYAAVVFLIAWGVGLLIQKVVEFLVRMLSKRIDGSLYRHLREVHFFAKSCRVIPPIVFLVLIEFTMTGKLGHWLTILTFIYLFIVIALALTALIDATWQHFDEKDNKRKLPLRGIVQLIKGVLWIITVIIAIALLVDKSPEKLLAGLGAFAAVLMLVFKDSILGVVAGVQLSENDTLHLGDWIKVHGTDANGTVSEVTLTAVKIQNWDKTVTTVPPYTLISTGFTNYRYMQVSGTRRIERTYFIDADCVTILTDDMLNKLKSIPLVSDFIDKKRLQRDSDAENAPQFAGLVDGTIETNLGLFRAYIQMYLNQHAQISHSDICFVTTLQQTASGIPLQIYCFTNTSSWVAYEAIQASIFEHLAVMLHQFGLCVYEAPSGRDTILEGWLPAAGLDKAFGVPYPMDIQSDILVNPLEIQQKMKNDEPKKDASKGNSSDDTPKQ